MLETKRLKLHIASREEMERYIEEQTAPELKQAYGEMLQGCLDRPDQWAWHAIWMIALKDGTHVGDLSFKGLHPDGSVEIGYGVTEAFQGQGYATEAVAAAVNWALAQPGVTKVEAETEPDNHASHRVLEKCGFVPTGETGEEGPRFIYKGKQPENRQS